MNIILFTDVNQIGYGKYAGPYRLASELRSNGYTVQVVDFFTKYTTTQFKQILDKFITDDTLWVGFTTTFNDRGTRLAKQNIKNTVERIIGRDDTLEIIEYIKAFNSKIKIVVGGAKADSLSLYSTVDHVIVGQGEAAAVALTAALKNNLSFPKRVTDNEYPFNEFNTSKIEYQSQDIIFDGEHLPIEIARGCIFKCSFCNYPLNGKKMWEYTKQPTTLSEELIRNYQLFKTKGYLISDDTLNDSVEKVEALHKTITALPFDLTLSSYARIDLMISHPHTLDLLYEMGFRSFFFGIETFNRDAGKAIGKGMDPDRIKKGIEDIKSRYPDLLLSAGLIFGLPNETKASLKDTINYLKDSPIDNVTVSPLVIHSKTPIGQNPGKYGFTVNHYNDWFNEHMTSKDAEDFTEEANIFLKPKNKISWWFMNRVINCGYTLDDCRTKTFTRKNRLEIKNRASILRDQYFEKLLKLNII
jgi:radical SAM superfamily enzyme YgiQ (UPF0313 family)